VSTTPGTSGNLLEFVIAPGIPEISWNLVEFYN